MSEYKPVTGELRDWFEHAYSYDVGETPWFGWKSTIEQMLDAIDSVHAALEADNERLRGEWDYWESTHVELPKDADGDYIHVGDMIKLPNCKREEVRFMTINGAGWLINEAGWLPCKVGHSNPDTWERIIEDAMGRYSDADADALVARCKALAGDAE